MSESLKELNFCFFNTVQECSKCDSEFISYGLVCSVFNPGYSYSRNMYLYIAFIFKCIDAFCYFFAQGPRGC